MIQSIETQSEIAILRAKGERGELTLEDMKAIVKRLRGDRKVSVVNLDQVKRTKAKAAIPDGDAELDALRNM